MFRLALGFSSIFTPGKAHGGLVHNRKFVRVSLLDVTDNNVVLEDLDFKRSHRMMRKIGDRPRAVFGSDRSQFGSVSVRPVDNYGRQR